MFNQNEGEKKLDWMYKGATSLVDREDYLLGRNIDRNLEQLNAEEKLKEQGGIAAPKNHVEHECIPPSIRDYKLQQQLAEQVDLQAKLQEDPLLAIKKREEETRRQFLQNPVQLKKLQKALSKQAKKQHKKSKSVDESILEKLKLLQGSSVHIDDNIVETSRRNDSKKVKKERDLDIILMHKFNALKSKLSESDLKDIMNCKLTDSDTSSTDTEPKTHGKRATDRKRRDSTVKNKSKSRKRSRNKRKKEKRHRSSSEEESSSDSDNNSSEECRKRKNSTSESSSNERDAKKSSKKKSKKKKYSKKRDENEDKKQYRMKSRQDRSRSKSKERKLLKKGETEKKTRILGPERPSRNFDYHSNIHSSDDEGQRTKPQNWGLVKSDGTKIPLHRRSTRSRSRDRQRRKITEAKSKPEERPQRRRVMSSKEKERILAEMIRNANEHDVERARNIKKYREDDVREENEREFNADFARKQFNKSANASTVESRIKANINNIQRNKNDMNSHFSRMN